MGSMRDTGTFSSPATRARKSVKDMSLTDFLALVAGELNVPVSRMEPIEKKLQDEWYEDVAALLEITDQQWSNFSLPMRVVDKIKEVLKTIGVPAVPKPPQPEPMLVEPESEETYTLLLSKHIETTEAGVHMETLKLLQVVLVNILKTNPT